MGAPKPDQVTRRSAASLSSASGYDSDSDRESEKPERSDSDSSTSCGELGEDPADFSSDDSRSSSSDADSISDIDDENYLDRQGNMSGDDGGDPCGGRSSDSD